MFEHVIFENYEKFITEHQSNFSTPAGAVKLISDNGGFRAYMEALLDGIDPAARDSVMAVANRAREELLTESMNVPASSFGMGWTVLSFPILVDIYAEPIIAK